MADNVVASDDELLKNIKTLLWGSAVKEDVFKRWAQGSGVLSRTREPRLEGRHVQLYSHGYMCPPWCNGANCSDSYNSFLPKTMIERFAFCIFFDITDTLCEGFRF